VGDRVVPLRSGPGSDREEFTVAMSSFKVLRSVARLILGKRARAAGRTASAVRWTPGVRGVFDVMQQEPHTGR
jgi:hypothetical protein